MNFGEALEELKKGKKVCREGWNGKGMFIFLTQGSEVKTEVLRHNIIKDYFMSKDEGTVNILPHIDMKSADDKIVIGWLASQADLLAEDWQIKE